MKTLTKMQILVCTMVFLVAGCQSNNNSAKTATSSNGTQGGSAVDTSKSIKIDVLNLNGSFSGMHPGWFAKFVKDKWNMDLNIIGNDGSGDTKFQTLAASGNLGDAIIFSNPGQNFNQAVKAGLLMDLSKNNLFSSYMPYFNANFPVAVQRLKTFASDGGIYGIPTRVSKMSPTESQNATEVNFGIMIRYDYYQGIAAPKLNTLEDLIPVFEKMKSTYPKTDDGKPTYAASLYNDTDGNNGMAHATAIAGLYGYEPITSGSILLVDNMAQKYQDVLKPDSYYMRALKFFYNLNQKGLLDPDSVTQKQADASAKFSAGQIFYSNWYWEAKNAFNTAANTAANKGYEMAPLLDQKISSPGFYPGGDNGPILAIGKNAKDPQRILNFFDWAYTSDGVMTLYNGPQNLTWNYGPDGKAVLTDFGVKALPQNKVDVPAEWGGGNFSDGFQKLSLYPLSNAETDPKTGEAYKFANWSSTLTNNMTNLDKTWSKNMGGARYTKEYLVKNNMLSVIPGNTFTIPPLTTDMKATSDQVGNIIKQYSWNMVLAKNDAQFNQLAAEMTQKAKDLGYDTLLNYYMTLLPQVQKARADAVASVKK